MEFAGENTWQWLRPYGTAARWIGWLLIIFGVCDLVIIFYGSTLSGEGLGLSLKGLLGGFLFGGPRAPIGGPVGQVLTQEWHVVRNGLLPGVMALGIAQFLRWLVERETQPGWLLRHGPKLMILAATFYFIQVVLMIWRIPYAISFFDHTSDVSILSVIALIIVPNLLMRAAPVIILFGMAEALRRMVPIVDESKSTV